LQGFYKTCQHRQRGPNFVRHIGHKVAPHGLGLLHDGNVTRQQQFAPITIGMQLHRQGDWPGGTTFTPRHGQAAAKIALGQVTDKTRLAHQVANGLHQVTLNIETKMRCRCLVTPLDARVAIEQHHAAGRHLQGRQKIMQAGLAVKGLALALAQHAKNAGRDVTPNAMDRATLGTSAVAQPAEKFSGSRNVKQHPARCCNHQTDRQGMCTGPIRIDPDT